MVDQDGAPVAQEGETQAAHEGMLQGVPRVVVVAAGGVAGILNALASRRVVSATTDPVFIGGDPDQFPEFRARDNRAWYVDRRGRKTFENEWEGLERQPPPGRNDPCPCGSGRKYKRCCLL